MLRQRLPDLDHGWQGNASLETAADDLDMSRTSYGDAFQRHVGAAIGEPTRHHL
jgi:hypothetical protein